MSTLAQARNAAGTRYAAAVTEFRAARAELAALDQLLGAPGFGVPPEIVPLRHAEFAPDVGGSLGDDIAAARQRLGV